jgi:hypothetical protein
MSIRSLFLPVIIFAVNLAQAAEPITPHWYKGNTHSHSLWSDGNDFPEMITDWYVKQGYNFLALSDHNILQSKEVWMSEAAIEKRRIALGKTTMDKYRARFGEKWVEEREIDGKKEVRLKKLEEYRPLFEKPEKFRLVEAEEISAKFGKAPIHINAITPGEVIKPVEGESIRDTLRKNLQAIRDQEKRLGHPIMAHVNHPNFQWGLTAEDLAEAVEENFFEIYNGHPKINLRGDDTRPGHELIWDIANTIRIDKLHAHPLFGMATDDSHHYHGEDNSPGRGWVMVQAEELSPKALIKAMRAGDFYASSGVTLNRASCSDKRLEIIIEPEEGVTYTTQIIGTLEGYDATVREVTPPEGDPQPKRLLYSADVGKTLATVTGSQVKYELTGKELYVRAVITSSKAHVNPSYPGQMQQAWTQPCGWEMRVR